MALDSVRVPPDMEELFRQAETVVSRYFRDRVHAPERGTIEICGERYVLVRAASLSVEFFDLVRNLFGDGRESEANDFARNILFDLAHALGRSDARGFHLEMNLSDPMAKLSAGPVHFAHAGWAFVDILPESRALPDPSYCLLYDHPYSFEADAWLDANRTPGFPVCIMGAGYSSGWCQESFGIELLASEVLCRARGDEACRFIMCPPDRIEDQVAAYRQRSPLLAGRMTGYQIPDFFARKRMEEELRKSRDDLEARVIERTTELQQSHDQLRVEMEQRQEMERRLLQSNKLEALGRLAGGIAHDFNNVLGIIMARTETIKRRLGDPSLTGELDRILAAANRAASLTGQLLTIAHGKPNRSPVIDLAATTADVIESLAPLIGEDIELELTKPNHDQTIAIEADPGALEQILMNLVVNARDAMPRGGRLHVSVAPITLTSPRQLSTGSVDAGDYALLTIADTGIGMSPEVLARIFEPFFTTKPAERGTGLGLPTVYGIVEQAGGGIEVTSQLERGTQFEIYLPRSRAQVDEPAGPGLAPRDPSGPATILLVEDEVELLDSLRMVLEDEGYRVLCANNPERGLELVASDATVDLLLTDLVMPRMDGRTLAEHARKLRPGLEVLLMSGWDPQAGRGAKAAGSVEVLAKPFTSDELLARLARLLDEGS